MVHHFPTLSEHVLVRALDEFHPDLWYTGDQVALVPLELRQFVHHVAASAALPVLDPPVYDPVTRFLAQYALYISELASGYNPNWQPPLGVEELIQAWRWDVPAGPALPPGVPGGGPPPSSTEVFQWLLALEQAGRDLPLPETYLPDRLLPLGSPAKLMSSTSGISSACANETSTSNVTE